MAVAFSPGVLNSCQNQQDVHHLLDGAGRLLSTRVPELVVLQVFSHQNSVSSSALPWADLTLTEAALCYGHGHIALPCVYTLSVLGCGTGTG